jgi:ATP-binding cassette subfamily F protein uup
MNRLVDHLFVFEGDGMIRDFPGNYSQYRIWLKEQEEKMDLERSPMTSKGAITKTNNDQRPIAVGQLTITKRQPSFKEKREFEMLEKEIADLTNEKRSITTKLGSSDTPFEELQPLSRRIAEVTQLLDEKELRWLELSEIK